MLERHINQHFKTPKDCSDGVTENATKLIRRNGQKLRYRRQVYSGIYCLTLKKLDSILGKKKKKTKMLACFLVDMYLLCFLIQLFLFCLLIAVRSRTDVFDAGIMSQLQYLLVQMAHRCQSVSLNVLDSKNFLHVTFQPKVTFFYSLYHSDCDAHKFQSMTQLIPAFTI